MEREWQEEPQNTGQPADIGKRAGSGKRVTHHDHVHDEREGHKAHVHLQHVLSHNGNKTGCAVQISSV